MLGQTHTWASAETLLAALQKNTTEEISCVIMEILNDFGFIMKPFQMHSFDSFSILLSRTEGYKVNYPLLIVWRCCRVRNSCCKFSVFGLCASGDKAVEQHSPVQGSTHEYDMRKFDGFSRMFWSAYDITPPSHCHKEELNSSTPLSWYVSVTLPTILNWYLSFVGNADILIGSTNAPAASNKLIICWLELPITLIFIDFASSL